MFEKVAPKSLIAALATWLLVAITVYLFVDRLVLRAFETLARKATRLADGEWKSVEVPFRPRGTNEAAELANAINKLCRSQIDAYRQAVSLNTQIQSNYENYKTIFTNSKNPMILTKNNIIVDYNKAAGMAIATTAENIIGKSIEMLMSPVAHNAREGEFEEKDEVIYAINERKYIESVSEVRWGQKLCNLHSLADISELLQLQKSLMSAQRMQLLGEFSGGIAHDINNILGAILGYQQLVETLGPLNSEQIDSLRQQEAFVYRGSKLVRRLLQFAKDKPNLRVEMEIVTVINDVLSLVRAMLPRDVQLVFDSTVQHQILLVDPDDVFQLCMNLCVNASQAMSGRGKIEISLRQTRPTFLNQLPSEDQTEEGFWLTVRDNGPGIPEKSLAEVFQPFFTTKQEHGGTGLGLATVKRICDVYGWDIHVANEGGAVFAIHLTRQEKSEPVRDGESSGVIWLDDIASDSVTINRND